MNNDLHTPPELPVTTGSAETTRWPRRMTVHDSRGIRNTRKAQHDFVNHVIDYSREHPGVAAFCCLSVGFILGWKLKPW